MMPRALGGGEGRTRPRLMAILALLAEMTIGLLTGRLAASSVTLAPLHAIPKTTIAVFSVSELNLCASVARVAGCGLASTTITAIARTETVITWARFRLSFHLTRQTFCQRS